ncbi:MAG: N(4)-(beta-N-acetylglucosaminyl)-L-asparaginase [Candidatus Aminicenantaceae bacterium]
MNNKLTRRGFLQAGISLGAVSLFARKENYAVKEKNINMKAVASGNGLRATEKAMELLKKESDPLDAVIAGVNIVEEDPNERSVGYGGLPNEEGEVELDASVMHGPTHNGGAVASLRNIKTPSKVAKLVMERTDHALLVGEGALKFARAHGFKEEDLLTDRAREIWLRRKETLSERDYWFPPKSGKLESELEPFLSFHGTINCIAIDGKANLAGVTTTSGFYFKIPGRVGDSPIIGAGLYVDNDVGAAGSTGRGEANILNCGSFTVVEFMRKGFSPEEACIQALKRIADKSKLQPRLLNEEGLPRFGLSFYAVNKKSEYGAASMWSGGSFVVHDGQENKKKDSAYLFKRKERK